MIAFTQFSGRKFLEHALAATSPYRCRLFHNDIPVSVTTDINDFVEATFAGYAYQSFNFEPVPDSPDLATSAASAIGTLEFVFTGGMPQQIYGYFVERDAGADFWYAERLPVPILLQYPGDHVRVRPTFFLRSQALP